MARARVEEEEVSIFNMSFLDVFCCTIGALLFILFIQTLRTRDMVERRELQGVQDQLAIAKGQLADLTGDIEKARDEKKKVEEDLGAAQRREKEQKGIIDELMERIGQGAQNPPAGAVQGLGPAGPGTGGALETQKTSRGQYLLGNLETLSVVCAGEGLYLGLSRRAIPVQSNANLAPLFRQVLRYHDPKVEGLWRTVWGDGLASLQASSVLQAQEAQHIGRALTVQQDMLLQRAQAAAKRDGSKLVELDADNDGIIDTQYEDTDGDGVFDVKRVNVDNDPFFEEMFLELDVASNQWARLLVDTDGDNQYDLLLIDTVRSDSDYEIKLVLPHLQTGNAVFRYEDTDNDGIWDVKYENTDLTNGFWEKTYRSFDVRHQRWAAVLEDADGNGKAEVLWIDADMSNDDWEERLVDTDGDGAWDTRWKDLDPRDNDWEAKFTQPKGDGVWQQCEVDSDQDGVLDIKLVDHDGDGKWDEEYSRDLKTGQWVKKEAGSG